MSAGLREVKIFSGSAHQQFAESICMNLGVPLSASKLFRFSDGEIGVSIEESVRGADVYVVQPTCEPANEHLMELLIIVDALRRASVYRVNLVMPYFGYARQDRKTRSREPITSKLIANLLEKAGADRVISADLLLAHKNIALAVFFGDVLAFFLSQNRLPFLERVQPVCFGFVHVEVELFKIDLKLQRGIHADLLQIDLFL